MHGLLLESLDVPIKEPPMSHVHLLVCLQLLLSLAIHLIQLGLLANNGHEKSAAGLCFKVGGMLLEICGCWAATGCGWLGSVTISGSGLVFMVGSGMISFISTDSSQPTIVKTLFSICKAGFIR